MQGLVLHSVGVHRCSSKLLTEASSSLPVSKKTSKYADGYKNPQLTQYYLCHEKGHVVVSSQVTEIFSINKLKCKRFHTIVRVLDAKTCRTKY